MVKKGAIWWSVNPFNDDISFQKNELKALIPLARAISSVIQPVTYIDTYRCFAGEGNFFPLMPLYADSYDEIEETALQRLGALRTNANRSILKETLFLTNDPERAPSLQDRVEAISNAAAKAGAAFVALRTHSRRGFSRFYMGSFAETFLLYTTVPTLVFRSETKVASEWRRILFPTDFSPESKAALAKLLPLFAKMRATVTFVHIWGNAISSYRKTSDSISQFRNHEMTLRKAGESFVKLASKKNVKSELKLVNTGLGGDTAEALILLSKKLKVDLIAMAAKSNPLKTALVGALTRKIVRNANCSVIVHRMK